jgi:hypothetical protein
MNGGDWKCIQKFCLKTRREKDNLGNLNIDVRKMLRWMLRKQGVRIRTGFIWLRIGSSYRIL